MSEQETEDESRVEHIIHVESTQVHTGDVTPENAERLTSDGSTVDMNGTEWTGMTVSVSLEKEVKRTYECRCGERFRKARTAREHLESES